MKVVIRFKITAALGRSFGSNFRASRAIICRVLDPLAWSETATAGPHLDIAYPMPTLPSPGTFTNAP